RYATMKSAQVSRKEKRTTTKAPYQVICQECGFVADAHSREDALNKRDFHSFDKLHSVDIWIKPKRERPKKLAAFISITDAVVHRGQLVITGAKMLSLRPPQ